MKRIRIVGLCLAAVFAFSAIAAASAYAEPEFTNPVGGNFPQHFTSEGGEAKLTTANNEIKCTKILDLGFILAEPTVTKSMLGDIKFTFHGCKAEVFGGETCQSSGEPNGLISTPTYRWHLGALKEVEVGGKKIKAIQILILVTETVFSCNSIIGAMEVKVKGNLVGLILEENAAKEKQFNKSRSNVEIEFKQKEKGIQEDREFEFTLPLEKKTELDLKAKVGGGGEELAAENATGIETLLAGHEVELKG